MRILHVFKTYYPESRGGIEEVIHQIARSTAPYGVKSSVFTLSNAPSKQAFEYESELVHQAKCHFEIASTRFSFTALKTFRDLVNEADVVHYQYPWPFMDALHLGARVRKPTVLSYQSDIVRQKLLLPFYRPLREAFLKRVDCIVATSPAYLKSSPVLQAYESKVKIIPNGICPYDQPIDGARLAHFRELCGERFLLFVGVLRYYKGLPYLLEALKGLDCPLVIVGRGPMEEELKAKAKALNLKVQFLGALPNEDKFALMKLCEGFVFPSHLRSEAYGISLLEAAMMEKPLISCEIQTGTTYINRDGETGWAVAPADSHALRQAIESLWTQPEEARRRGLAAKARYEAMFTAEKMAEQYLEVYRDLLK